MDFSDTGTSYDFKTGIAMALYTGALVSRSLLPLTGNLIISCVPRTETCDYGIKHLFENFIKARSREIKGVLLCEPTGLNLCLGHKGRMEYQIVIKGNVQNTFVEPQGINMLGTMFPLISELEKVSRNLTSDSALGLSTLKIKDVSYSDYHHGKGLKEFKVVVDRTFSPEDDFDSILKRAKSIAMNVYRSNPEVAVETLIAKSRIKTYRGVEMISEKEFNPWKMESHNPFALSSLQVLKENGFNSDMGYWKNIVTEGSYTFGKLRIPTIGFGPGSESSVVHEPWLSVKDELEKAVYGAGLIIHRNIGMPTFGWSADEI
jgi:acetylornithine deacetylase/succinyl-diaminopimelate desuccinylase-like protein